ncbi:MAG: hypothetical protein R3C27_12770 [Hyphomonadaceae bacterium]
MSDNVTPFRRPKPVRPQQQGGLGIKTHRGKVVLAHLLTIAAFLVNFFLRGFPWSLLGLVIGVAAVLIVYANRGTAMPWANTHHEHALRTLIIGYALWMLAGLLILISDGLANVTIILQLGIAIWAVLRAGVALVLGVMRKPIPNPRGWFI